MLVRSLLTAGIDTTVHGLSMAQYQLPGLVTYAVAVAGFVNLPEDLAGARAATRHLLACRSALDLPCANDLACVRPYRKPSFT